jgi:hypothetical protein
MNPKFGGHQNYQLPKLFTWQMLGGVFMSNAEVRMAATYFLDYCSQ